MSGRAEKDGFAGQDEASLEIPVLVAFVQLGSQDLEIGEIDLKQPLEPWSLNLDHHLLACVQDSPVHLHGQKDLNSI